MQLSRFSLTFTCLAALLAGCATETLDDVESTGQDAGAAADSTMQDAATAASDAATSVEDAAGSAAETVENTATTASDAASAAADAAASVTQLTSDLGSAYTSATETLTGITDEASAQAAVPKLEELSTKLDGLKALWEKLPESARDSITSVTGEHLGKFKDLAATVLAIPGVKEKIEPILTQVIEKFSAIGS
jgi:hypothetical protein